MNILGDLQQRPLISVSSCDVSQYSDHLQPHLQLYTQEVTAGVSFTSDQ